MRKVSNAELAKIFREMAIYLDMQGVAFKPRAYERVAESISAAEEDVQERYEKIGEEAFKNLDGVGRGIADHLVEIFKTGKLRVYEDLKKKIPVNLGELFAVEGLGPKSIKKLYEKLKIKNLSDLERAAAKGKIRSLEGFGEKTEENILKSISFLKQSGGRMPIGQALPLARALERRIGGFPGVAKVVVAGSLRRRKETIGDIDVLVIAKNSKPVMDSFVSMAEVARVLALGETKSSVHLSAGLDADLRVVPAESYGAALNYFTGSKDHNVALRQIAVKKGLKLNEYGLFKGSSRVAGRTEEEIYKKLGLAYVEPEMREMRGEIAAAQAGDLPRLIKETDILGDLQVQTDWTDGSASIEAMARAAEKLGRKYILITDHTKRLTMAHGLDDKRIVRQWAEIDRVQKKFGSRIKILKGTECDILKDGSLDLEDETLARLDVVGVSVHSYFNLSRTEQTERVMRAMRNPNVDILFHPTGRVLNRREAYDLDMQEVIKEAKKTKTVLEIDAFPDRLDLKDEHIRMAKEAGVKMAIDTDAHALQHLAFMEYGVAQARRGWAEKGDVVNAWPLDKMRKMLK